MASVRKKPRRDDSLVVHQYARHGVLSGRQFNRAFSECRMSNSEYRMTKVDAAVGYYADLIKALINSKFF